MATFLEIDNQIQKGYTLIHNVQTEAGCNEWLHAWEDIKELFVETGAKDIYDLNRKYNWEGFPSNYVQMLMIELRNAGLTNPEYYRKRAEFCGELAGCYSKDDVMASKVRCAIGESYALLRDYQACDQYFEDCLREDPAWGQGYIGWANCYEGLFINADQPDRAEQIYIKGLEQPGIWDKLDIALNLADFYKRTGKLDKARETKTLCRELQKVGAVSACHYTPLPSVAPEKTGRNMPCPCGSGKKYKKCCGF